MARVAEPRIKFTKADYCLLPEGFRVELIDGDILKMAPPTVLHQELAKRFFLLVLDCVGVDRVLFGPIGLDIDDTNILVPDVVAFGKESIPDLDAQSLCQAEMVVEVLSPSTAARDRAVKAGLYLEAGVSEVWLIDPRSQSIEIQTAAGERAVRGNETATSEAVSGFSVRPADLFA